MRRNRFLGGLLVLVCIALSVPMFAQDNARGSLSGIVLDTSQSYVPAASVTITGPIGSLTQPSTEQGSFLFSTLIPGMYVVKVEKQGFKVSSVRNVEVLINKTTSIRVIIEPGQLTQIVEVSAPMFTVDTSGAAVNADMADTFYQNIPIQRGVASLFYVAPGVASGLGTGNANPSISGASGLENLYVADGVSITTPGYGGLGVWSTGYGALGSGINLSFVKEVQVKTAAFEPQYGQSTGGIVQIVTKSGGTAFHGAVNGYFNTTHMQTLFANADDAQFHLQNKIGRHLDDTRYEADVEFGGYVPLASLKNHLFFYGNVSPYWRYEHWAPALGSGLFDIYNGNVIRKTFAPDYAGKLTYKFNDKHMVEGSVFGDPNRTDFAPWATLNSDNASANSKLTYGTRNLVARYNGTLSPSWTLNAAFTYNWNSFTETPATNIYHILDQTQTFLPEQRGQFDAQGLGFIENYASIGKGFNFDTSKIYHFAGQQHTFMLGYLLSKPTYDDITDRSGPRFNIPLTNATGGGYLSTRQLGFVTGQASNAEFSLRVDTSGDCTLCPLMSIPQGNGTSLDQPVFLKLTRGTFSSGVSHNTGEYHTAYINDSWEMGRHVTLNMGVRWEQQRINGVVAGANFHNMWDPRISFIVDPKGDRKTKIYAGFSRLAFVLPLDIAIRSLSSEADLIGTQFAPASTACDANLVGGCVTLNSFGTVTPVLDAAHVLDLATGGLPKATGVSIQSGGEPYVPTTSMEYNDEFVVGAEHEFRGGIFVSARYIDRRMKRVIEDFSGISVEGGVAGLTQTYVIGNPSATTDNVTNPNEITFSLGAAYSGQPLPAGCFDSNGNLTPFGIIDAADTFGTIRGSACFPAVNMNPWTDASGNILPGALFGGEPGADGKPDGFNNPKREYQALEIEVNKAMSHNWSLLANWRIARLQGNYEGAFRNDNTQADPGISSLFDLTPGLLGLLGQQQGNGVLNTDRKHVVNVYTTYILDRSPLKNLVLGSGFRLQTGVPLTTLTAQEFYQNAGEVPVFGRGDLGRAPVTATVDVHVEYPWKLNERMTLKFGMDLFNIGNTKRQTLINQNKDLEFGVLNSNFGAPRSTYFIPPFQSRGIIRFEF